MLKSILSAGLLSVLAAASPVEKRQSVPIITSCTNGGFALAFDDGPYIYTSGLLDQLASAGVKATFFVNGQNYGNIYDYSAVIQRMAAEGHQVASHTWDHKDLTTLDEAGITSELTQIEDALQSIIGVKPAYLRPPYYAYNDQVLSILASLGYSIVTSDIDTLDWSSEVNAPDVFQTGLNNGGSLTLCHDPLPETVSNLVPYIINAVKAKGLTFNTVAECVGGSPYKGTAPPPSNGGGSGPVSPDSTCGGSNGYTCPSGECCSQYGWCGTSGEYCGAGCQGAFGSCS